jgi:hypothetical protein
LPGRDPEWPVAAWLADRLGGDQSGEEQGGDGDERDHPQRSAQRGKAGVAVGFHYRIRLIGRDVAFWS